MFLGSNEDAHLGALINSSHESPDYSIRSILLLVLATVIIAFYFGLAGIRRFLVDERTITRGNQFADRAIEHTISIDVPRAFLSSF